MAVLITELCTQSEGSEEDRVGYEKSILKTVQTLNCLIRETKEVNFIRLMVFPLFAFVFEEVMKLK
jgi:hypothetical protein